MACGVDTDHSVVYKFCIQYILECRYILKKLSIYLMCVHYIAAKYPLFGPFGPLIKGIAPIHYPKPPRKF